MSISNPIDQLIHNLEQERAKEYGRRVQRLKNQEVHQRQAAEEHEKKQLQYMRSAGVRLEEIEQGREEEARRLKSYLERTRHALISRPSQSVQDAKRFADQTARVAGLGSVVPPSAGYYYPPDTSGEVLPLDPSRIKIKRVCEGQGWGWSGGPFNCGPEPPPPVDVVFYFVPDQDATYSLTASFAFHGFYVLQAADGAFTSKYAEVDLFVSMDVFQYIDRGTKSFPNPIHSGSQNINEFDNFDHTLTFSDTQSFRQGEPVVVTVSVAVDALARGSGSYAEINFADGDANYIAPQYLWVTNLTSFGQ